MIYLVKYIAQNTIEGYVLNKKDVMKWLKKHNIERLKRKEFKEFINEFKIIKVNKLEVEE